MTRYIGALDLGTTSSRFIIFDPDGRMVGWDQREHRQIFPRPSIVPFHQCVISFFRNPGVWALSYFRFPWEHPVSNPLSITIGCYFYLFYATRSSDTSSSTESTPRETGPKRFFALPLCSARELHFLFNSTIFVIE